jgi:hypoxanthine phosphoribosyltransferase
MVSQKKFMKFAVLFIMVVFLLSTALVSVMYFVDMEQNMPEVDTWFVITWNLQNDIEVLPSNILKDITIESDSELEEVSVDGEVL